MNLKNGLIEASDYKEIVRSLKNGKQSNTTIFPSGISINMSTEGLMITCKCKKNYKWNYSSKIPRKTFTCECGKTLIRYIKNRKYQFIGRS